MSATDDLAQIVRNAVGQSVPRATLGEGNLTADRVVKWLHQSGYAITDAPPAAGEWSVSDDRGNTYVAHPGPTGLVHRAMVTVPIPAGGVVTVRRAPTDGMTVYLIEGDDLAAVGAVLDRGIGAYALRIAIDEGGVKFKVNNGTWSLPHGKVEP